MATAPLDAVAPPPALPAPKTSRGERTRQRILDAAERDIGRRGFSEASISTITQEAAVAQGTFYLYFRSKEDVMRELVLRMGRRLRRHLTLATTGLKDRLEIEKRGLQAFLSFVRDNPNLYRVVAESQFVDEIAYQRYYYDFADNYRQALSEAEGAGQLSSGDAELRAWALMGISDFIGRRYALWDKDASIEAVTEAAFAFISHGIAPNPLEGKAP